MPIRSLVFVTLFSTGVSVYASDLWLLRFELLQDNYRVEVGTTYVSEKPAKWSKGFKRRYLKVHCHRLPTGEIEKQYSTEDYFAGLQVSHQRVENTIVLTVVRTTVKPSLETIQAMPEIECRDIGPKVSTTTETYSFNVKQDLDESRTFGKNMTFRSTLQTVIRSR